MRKLFVSYDEIDAAAKEHGLVPDPLRSDHVAQHFAPWHAIAAPVEGGWMFWEDAREYQTWRNQV